MLKALRQYKDSCNEILRQFANKYSLTYGEDVWVDEHIGTKAKLDQYYFHFYDIVTALEKNVPKEDLLEWYNYDTDLSLNYWMDSLRSEVIEKLKEEFSNNQFKLKTR